MKYYGEKLHKHSQSGPFFCPCLHFLKYSCFPKKNQAANFQHLHYLIFKQNKSNTYGLLLTKTVYTQTDNFVNTFMAQI